MPTKTLTTGTLLSRLFRTQSISRFLNTYSDEIVSEPLSTTLNRLCDEKQTIPADIIKKADIDRTYGHQIFSGTKKNPSRDVVLQLAFGFEMNYDEAQQLLKAASHVALSPRVERDAVVIFALNKKYSIIDVQAALHELNIPLLGQGNRK